MINLDNAIGYAYLVIEKLLLGCVYKLSSRMESG